MQVRTENNGKDGKSGESPLFNLVFPLPTVHLSHQPTFRAFSLRALVYTVTFTCQFLREIFPDYTQLGRAVIIIATYYFILQNLFSLFPSFLFVPFTSLEVICNLTPYFLQLWVYFQSLFLFHWSICLSLKQYSISFITISLQQDLHSDSVCSFFKKFFWLFQILSIFI